MRLKLAHWGRVAHKGVSKLTAMVSDNGVLPGRPRAIIWANAGILLIGHLATKFNEVAININTFLFKKIHLKMSGKWRLFCLGISQLRQCWLLVSQKSRDVLTWRWPQDRPIYLYPPSMCRQIKLGIPAAISIQNCLYTIIIAVRYNLSLIFYPVIYWNYFKVFGICNAYGMPDSFEKLWMIGVSPYVFKLIWRTHIHQTWSFFYS